MRIGNRRNAFQLYDNLIVTDKIGLIMLSKNLALIGEVQYFLGGKRNVSSGKLSGQTFLINRFQKACAHMAADFENGTLNSKDFVSKKQFLHASPFSCLFVFFVAKTYSSAMIISGFSGRTNSNRPISRVFCWR